MPADPDIQATSPTTGGESAARTGPQRIGKYQLLRGIASGGMGEVYIARHVGLDKQVAIKLLKQDFPGKSIMLERFQREAQVLARLNHPNVVHALDVGFDRGVHYIVMDYAPGMDLRRWLKRDGKLNRQNFTYVARQLMEAIASAHDAEIVHRDIKPDNVIVDQFGNVKVTDFGLASDILRGGREAQQQDFATLPYAAPEVLRGQPSDRRSDVFSLAATLYHAASGLLPFGRASTASILAAQQKGAPDLALAEPDLPPALLRAIMQALSIDPFSRPANGRALLELAFPARPGVATRAKALLAPTALVVMLGFTAWISYSLSRADAEADEERDTTQSHIEAGNESRNAGSAPSDDAPASNGDAIHSPADTVKTTISVDESAVRNAAAGRIAGEWAHVRDALVQSQTPALRIRLLREFLARHQSAADQNPLALAQAKESLSAELKSRDNALQALLSDLRTSTAPQAEVLGRVQTFSSISVSPDAEDATTRDALSTGLKTFQQRNTTDLERSRKSIESLWRSQRPWEAIAEAEAQQVRFPELSEVTREYRLRANEESQRRERMELDRMQSVRQQLYQRVLPGPDSPGMLSILKDTCRKLQDRDLQSIGSEVAAWRAQPGDVLAPVIEHAQSEVQAVIDAYAWMQEQLATRIGREIRVYLLDGDTPEKEERVLLEAIDGQALRIAGRGGVDQSSTVSISDLGSRSWPWFIERQTDMLSKERGRAGYLRLLLLDKDADGIAALRPRLPASLQAIADAGSFAHRALADLEGLMLCQQLEALYDAVQVERGDAAPVDVAGLLAQLTARGSVSESAATGLRAWLAGQRDTLAYFNEAASLSPLLVDPHLLVRGLLSWQGSETHCRALALSAGSGWVLDMARSEVYLRTGQNSEARSSAEAALQLNPYCQRAWLVLQALKAK